MKQDPTLYEPKSKFCEIASAIGGIIGGVGSIIGGSMASSAAKDASGAQLESSRLAAELGREGLGFQQEMFDVGRADRAPYAATGGAALHTMSNMFLPGGQGMVQLQGQLNELRAQRATMAGQEQRGAVPPVQQAAAAPGAFTQTDAAGRSFGPANLVRQTGPDSGLPVNTRGDLRERASSA